MVSENSPWKSINHADLLKQKAIFMNIIQAKWQNPVSERKAITQLETVEFKNIEVIYDIQGMFPTIIGHKSYST